MKPDVQRKLPTYKETFDIRIVGRLVANFGGEIF